MALSDDEATMSNFFSSCFNVSHPSLEVSLLQGALMKSSLRCVISGADPGGGSGGSDEPPLAPKITHLMCLSDLL